MLGPQARQAAPPAAEEVAVALREVLARPEFQPAAGRPGRGLWARAIRWLFDALDRLLPDIPSLPGGPILNAIAIAALAAGAFVLVRRLARNRRRRGAPAPAMARGESAPPTEPALERTAEEWEARARELLAAGHPREAALALYQAVLRRLADAGLIRYDTSKTPGDYRREMADAPAAAGYVAFLRRFEPLAFGRVPERDGDVPTLLTLAREAAPGHG